MAYRILEENQDVVRDKPKFRILKDGEPERKTGSGTTGTWEERSFPNEILNIAKDVGLAITNPTVSETMSNIPGSAYKYGEGLVQSVIPKKESYYIPGGEAVRGIANVGAGVVQKLIPGEQGKEPYADAIGKFFADRYGGMENLKKTIINDPVGFAADVSAVLSLGGSAAGKAGQLTGATRLAETGRKAAQIGRAIEPVNATIKMVKPIVKVGGSLGAQLHGRFMSGAGAEATKQAFQGKPGFIEALRGAIIDQDIIDKSKSALHGMREAEVKNYGKQFNSLIKSGKGIELNIEPVKERIVQQMHDLLNIKFEITKDIATGELVRKVNYANTPLPEHQLSNVKKVVDIVNKWDDLSIKGVDYLKRNLDNFYIGSSDTRQYDKFINAIRSSIKNELTKQVPGYEKMTSKYSKFLNLEEEIQKSLSMGNKAAMDTTLRKLLSAMRENFEYRKELVQTLDNVSGGNLLPQLAGLSMQSYLPKGLIGKLEIGSLGILTYMHGIDPVLATALLMSSPRLSGEFLYMLGKTAKQISKGVSAVESKAGTTARQVFGQTEKLIEEKQ